MKRETELRKFKDKKRGLKITLLHNPDSKTYVVHQKGFIPTAYNKLSAANYHFEDVVFQSFLNQLPLAEFVNEKGKR